MPRASPRAWARSSRVTWSRSALSTVSQRATSTETAMKARIPRAMARARMAPPRLGLARRLGRARRGVAAELEGGLDREGLGLGGGGGGAGGGGRGRAKKPAGGGGGGGGGGDVGGGPL